MYNGDPSALAQWLPAVSLSRKYMMRVTAEIDQICLPVTTSTPPGVTRTLRTPPEWPLNVIRWRPPACSNEGLPVTRLTVLWFWELSLDSKGDKSRSICIKRISVTWPSCRDYLQSHWSIVFKPFSGFLSVMLMPALSLVSEVDRRCIWSLHAHVYLVVFLSAN